MTSFSPSPGPKNLITDVPGILVGNTHDAELKSGCTVLTSAKPFVASVDVMGGAPGTRETDLLDPDRMVEEIDALVLSGGSAFGLDAASGVANALHRQGRGFSVGPACVPIVPAAILFDLNNGGDKNWQTNPYAVLGQQALDDATADFDLGTIGAGYGAATSVHKGGLGPASLRLENGISVGALVAANPRGSVTTPGGKHFWAAPFEVGSEFGGVGVDPRNNLGAIETGAHGMVPIEGGNTTIAIIATDASLTKTQCKRVAIAAQDGIGRAVLPAHSPFDGDLVFAAATARHECQIEPSDVLAIGHAASICLARAIARGIFNACAEPGDILPSWRSMNIDD